MKKIPKSVTVPTGYQYTLTKTIDDFFIETKDFIVSKYGEGPYFEIESGEIASQPNVVTDNRITYLLYKKRIVACVLETRNDFNNVHYDFFRNINRLEE